MSSSPPYTRSIRWAKRRKRTRVRTTTTTSGDRRLPSQGRDTRALARNRWPRRPQPTQERRLFPYPHPYRPPHSLFHRAQPSRLSYPSTTPPVRFPIDGAPNVTRPRGRRREREGRGAALLRPSRFLPCPSTSISALSSSPALVAKETGAGVSGIDWVRPRDTCPDGSHIRLIRGARGGEEPHRSRWRACNTSTTYDDARFWGGMFFLFFSTISTYR